MDSFNNDRKVLNQMMAENDSFFQLFGKLDDEVYKDGAIPKKYKELTGLSISILSRCEECVLYHLQECVEASADKEEMIEAIKMGVIGGGSITYPTARFAFRMMEKIKILSGT